MDDVFKVPAHHQIHIENGRNGNMSRIVARSRPHNRSFQVSVSEVIRLRRGVDNLDLLRRQVRQNGTHRVGANASSSSVTLETTTTNWPCRASSKNRTLSVLNSSSKHPPNTDVSA